VRRGLVFRSAHLGGLTDADRAALGALGVRTIVDLRGVSEAAETPHQIEGLACKVVGAHIEPQLGEQLRAGVENGTLTPFVVMELLTDHYRDYPRRCAPGFRTLFTTLSDGTHRPLVFHCTAGKDRTGFASALLLTLLGVHWDDVMEDYLRTNELWTGHIGRYPELDIDTRAAIVEARRPYLEAAFAAVRDDYGSVDAFAEKALGLDAKARDRLKAELLE
jgi:protein-tyrosine phosphatase